MLEVAGLSAWYGQAQALKDVAFRVDDGELITLVGRNGAGKTTTLPCLVGLHCEMLMDAKREGLTALLVEQNLRFATAVADRHYLLAQGEIVETLDNAAVAARERELLHHLGV